MIRLKKLWMPESNETKLVDAVQLWEVRWRSRHGEFSGDTQPELETFTSEKEAMDFATALENAQRLLRHTSPNPAYFVRVTRGKSAQDKPS